jgi:hypothetical protein
MATPPSMLPIDEELQDALSKEAAYDQNLYFMRSLMGTGISTGQDALDFIGDMSATSKAMGAPNIKRIEELKRKEGAALEGREGRIDAKTAAAKQTAAKLSQEVATQMAQDPSRAAGIIQKVGEEEARIVGTAEKEAETFELIKEASAEKQRVEELIPREQAEMERKQARKRAKFDLVRDMFQNLGQLALAGRPETREAKLESQEIRGAKKGAKIGERYKKASARGASDERLEKIYGRGKSAFDKSEAAGAELDALARAKAAKDYEAAKEAARWRGYNPLPYGQSAKKHPSVYIEDLRTKSPYTVDQPWKTEK